MPAKISLNKRVKACSGHRPLPFTPESPGEERSPRSCDCKQTARRRCCRIRRSALFVLFRMGIAKDLWLIESPAMFSSKRGGFGGVSSCLVAQLDQRKPD